ncbi:MAG: extracellular solute-binding protein [Candidatus Bathyarchaeota archaeon]|nr:extracellular solute-binding protein [Candidatus Bathyarchaeota archaeon]MDH5494925.1 extracellular solute-binding protein [Candidatus Bathyarchaeota archaeon]
MSANNKMMDWILAILLIVVIIVSGLSVYYSTTTVTKMDDNYADLLEAIRNSNASSSIFSEAILKALEEIALGLNITLPLTIITQASPTQGEVNLTVSFRAMAIGGTPPYTYEWDFDDQTPTNNERDPIHVYTNASTYTATVLVTDSEQETALDSVTIRVTSAEALTVFSLWGGSEEENFLQALGNFTEDTGIEVNHYSYTTQELLIGVPMQLRAGYSIADVVIAPWPAWILELAPYLTSVNDIINSTKYPANTINAVKDANDVIWAAPFKLSGKPGFWYKKSFFSDNGLTVPTTYDEFKTLLVTIQGIAGIEQAVASGDTVGWPLSDTTEAFIMGLGGYQLQEELITGPSARNWTDTEVRNVFGNLTELLAAGYFSAPAEWTSQITKFWDEKYGIYFMGSWMTTMEQIGDVSDLDFFGFPGTDGVAGSVDYLILPKDAPNPNEAAQLVEWLAGAEAQEIMVGLGGFFGTNIDVPDTAYLPLDKKVLDFISQATIHIVSDLDDAVGGKFQTTFWDQLKLLWVDPTPSTLDDVLAVLEAAALEQQT